MAFTRLFFFILLSSFLTTSFDTSAQEKQDYPFSELYLATINTKQALENIRFISNDGDITYFQKNSGSLYVSKSYSTKQIFQDIKFTQYSVISSPSKKKVVISKDKNYFSELNLKKENDLFVADYGTINTSQIGRGTQPELHLDDTWVSFYSEDKNHLFFQSLLIPQKKYTIPTTASPNSFFQFSRVMIEESMIIYTDETNDKFSQVILIYPQTNQKQVLYQSSFQGASLSLCRDQNYIVISEFSKNDINKGSSIMVANTKESPALKKINTVYNSKSNDLGQSLCLDGKIYFLKSSGEKRIFPKQDLFSIDLKTSTITRHTKNRNLQSLFAMDKRIITVIPGEYRQISQTPPPSKALPSNQEEQESEL